MKKITFTRRLLFFLFTLLMFSAGMYASSAYPGWINFRQPDGSFVKMKLMGDEFVHYGLTIDGYTLLSDSDGFMVYATKDGKGNMVPSRIRATDVNRRSSAAKMLLDAGGKGLTFSPEQNAKVNMAAKARMKSPQKKSESVSVKGDKKVLVILMAFPDKPFTKSNADFDKLMNIPGNNAEGAKGSVNDFYKEASFGQLNLTAQVAGPYMAKHESSYYGHNQGGGDAHARELIQEAVAAADADVDFSQFDANKDGVVDGLHVIYAGYGEEAGGGPDCIWAHKSQTWAQADGVTVTDYSCSPELRGNGGDNITYIGVICHELGHMLGCMDYYDTNYGVDGQFDGTGVWDLMGSGNWNGDGATPAHFNPFVECYDFGWIKPDMLSEPTEMTLKNGEPRVCRFDTHENNEFFLMENRQQKGFDAGLPGHGLMIYRARVGADGEPNDNSNDQINATSPQNMYPVCAGTGYAIPNSSSYTYGIINSGFCPFPGMSDKNEFTDESTPSSMSLRGLCSEQPVTAITEEGGNISFTFNGGTGNASDFHASEISTNSITLAWKPYQNKNHVMLIAGSNMSKWTPENKIYSVGDMVDEGNAKVVFVGDTSEYTLKGLDNNTKTYFRLFTQIDDSPAWSSGVNTMVKTSAGLIVKFPYTDDFSSMDWAQKQHDGTYKWTKTVGYGGYDGIDGGIALWHVKGFDPQSAMLISPKFDLSRSQSAVLTFDCRFGTFEDLQVCYRPDSISSWIPFSMMQGESAWKRVSLEIPGRSSSLQIGFLAVHDFKYASGLGDDEAFIALDNVRVDAGFAVKPVTGMAENIHTDNITVPVQLFHGTDAIEQCGVEISDGVNTRRILLNDSLKVFIEGLKGATSYSYHAYAVTQSGTYVGETFNCTTLNFSKGSGTGTDPYRVETQQDLEAISKSVWNGNDLSGCFFRMENDIRLTSNVIPVGGGNISPSTVVKGIVKGFNGIFDGNNKTISNFNLYFYQGEGTSLSAGLFGCISKSGVVKNLTISALSYYGSQSLACVGIVSAINYGAIINCHCNGGEINISSPGNDYAGGVVGINCGYIYSCTNKISIYLESDVSFEGAHLGGIAAVNYHVVKGCVNYGQLECRDVCNAGGIVGKSGYQERSDHPANNTIEDCLNYGNLSANSNWGLANLGGIVGESLGKITCCGNNGNITQHSVTNTETIGGLIGTMSAFNTTPNEMTDCFNRGNLTFVVTATGNTKISYMGGLCGLGGLGGFASFIRCYNAGKISAMAGVKVAPFYVRDTNGDNIVSFKDCFMEKGCTDSVTDDGLTVSQSQLAALTDTFNVDKRASAWILSSDGYPDLRPLPSGYMTSDAPVYYNPFDVTFPVAIVNIQDNCYLDYKKQDGDNSVNTVAVDHTKGFELINVSGLNPGTPYYYRLRASNGYVTEWKEFSTYFEGSGTLVMPYIVDGLDRMKALSILANQGVCLTDRHFQQTANIDLETDEKNPWNPIGEISRLFRGTFDGGGFSITHLYVDDNCLYAGLFGYCNGINNVHLVGDNVINACHSLYAGGIVGSCYFGNGITNSSFHGKITGGTYTGGLCGYSVANLNNSCAVIDINGKGILGGLLGYGNIQMNSCYAVMKTHPDGAAALLKNGVWLTNCYCQEGDSIDVGRYSTGLTEENMKSTTFVTNLGSSYWRADNAVNPVNEGYPLPSVMSVVPAVFTLNAKVVDDVASLNATCFTGGNTTTASGFEWRAQSIRTSDGSELATENSNYQQSGCGIASSTDMNVQVDNLNSSTTYSYRAYIDVKGSRVYGEEKTFFCDNGAKVSLDKHDIQLAADKGCRLLASISAANQIKRQLIWTSNDISVATVDDDGNLKALGKGNTYIHVSLANTSSEDSCLVMVTDQSDDIHYATDIPKLNVCVGLHSVTVNSADIFDKAVLCNIDGVVMAKAEQVSFWHQSGLLKGIYVLKIQYKHGIKTFKISVR